MERKLLNYFQIWKLQIITHAGEKTHGFNREDDSPPFNFCR